MNVSALVIVGVLALIGLVAGMLQHADHLNRPALNPTSGGSGGNRVWEAVPVIDPLTPQELELGRLDHGAESFAVHADIFRTDHEWQREEHARQVWNAGFDWWITKMNREFDALVADLPTTGEDPFDPTYWPPVSAVPTSGLPGRAGPPVTLQWLATFSPEATIQIIKARNAVPTVFSWSTQEQPLVRGHGSVQVAQAGTVTLVRERTPATRLRLLRGKHARHRR